MVQFSNRRQVQFYITILNSSQGAYLIMNEKINFSINHFGAHLKRPARAIHMDNTL